MVVVVEVVLVAAHSRFLGSHETLKEKVSFWGSSIMFNTVVKSGQKWENF